LQRFPFAICFLRVSLAPPPSLSWEWWAWRRPPEGPPRRPTRITRKRKGEGLKMRDCKGGKGGVRARSFHRRRCAKPQPLPANIERASLHTTYYHTASPLSAAYLLPLRRSVGQRGNVRFGLFPRPIFALGQVWHSPRSPQFHCPREESR